MIIARTLNELESARNALGHLAFVPTMGALHRGHLTLIDAAKASGLPVAASIFVNPTQFGPNEDLSRYPRDELGDLEKLERAGCKLVWLPSVDVMYPKDGASTIHVGGPALRWEGAARPRHFSGVATVVAKLFGQTCPERAYFGEKDWQQVQVVKRVVNDMHLSVEIFSVPTVREADGLALSSRNRYLSAPERALAPALHAELQGAARAILNGGNVAFVLEEARQRLADHGLAPDYVALVHASTLEPLDHFVRPARIIAAVRLGSVRLLDNLTVG